MSRTALQTTAAQLQNRLHEIVAKCDAYTPARAMALGNRLVSIMCVERSPEFLAKVSTVSDTFTGKNNGEDVDSLIKEINGCAKHLETNKHPKEANFCRAIATVLSGFKEADVNRAAMPLSRAGVKAWYAGGDKEQITAAYLLLF